MTALAASSLALVGPSQPPSQSSSPASPTASFAAVQQAAIRSAQATHFRSGSSRPGTPIGGGGSVNGTAALNGPPLEPPAGMSFAEFVHTWGDSHVARWLAALDPHGKCAAHASAFCANDVRGGVLLELDQASLREIGVTSIGDRIRILNAVKMLRVRCSNRAQQAVNGVYGAGGHAQGASVSSLASSSGSASAIAGSSTASPKVTVNGADHHDFPRAHSPQLAAAQAQHRNRSRPAPLQLRNASQSDLPKLIRDPAPPPDSARALIGTGPSTPVRPLPNPTQTSSQSGTPVPSTSASGRQHLPPVPPVPTKAPPLPPAGPSSSRGQPPRVHALASQQSSGRRTPTQTDGPPPPAYAPPPVPASQAQAQDQSSASSSHLAPGSGSWKGEYGLPAGPRSGGAGRATSPLPTQIGRRSPAHTKAPSYSAPSSAPVAGLKPAPRPSTTGTHPYGGSGNGSSSSSSSSGGLQPPQPSQLVLSPIAESFITQLATPTSLSPATAGTASSSSLSGPGSASSAPSAYQVGRGPFRPSTPTHLQPGAPTLGELRRRLVRFLLAEDGHSAVVDVSDTANGVELFERVLRKFGKLSWYPPGSNVDELVSSDDGGLSIDGWAVYLDLGHQDGPAKPLREAELLSLCSSYDHPYRESGLTIRRTGKLKRSKAFQQIFGDSSAAGPSSPHSAAGSLGVNDEDGSNSVAFPRSGTPNQEKEKELRNMKRASSISVLSGLGVRDPERVLDDSSSSSLSERAGRERGGTVTANNSELVQKDAVGSGSGKSPSTTTFAGRIRTFLGARPPSELIATHLPAYFPYTQPKVLRRTVRQSMRFSSASGGRRDSTISVATLAARRASRRVSTASRLSAETQSRVSMSSLPPPPVPEKEAELEEGQQETPPRVSLSTSDGQSVDLDSEESKQGADGEKGSTPHILPPVNFPSESFADAFSSVTGGSRPGSGTTANVTPPMSRAASSASRRFSYMNELRARRDRSDTASMLTVDEITAEVANRRKSAVPSVKSFIVSDSGAAEGGESSAQSPGMDEVEIEVPSDEENFEIIEDDEELEEMEEEDEFEDDELEGEDDDEATLAEEEEDDAPVKATGGKRGIKWIRGALIGAGSFGSVYLGMDAMNGLLMAVKQVELPTGTGPNEQRKKSMLDALEREIDFLRELQHDNIVQYLDSSSDDKHLNIFLEYVPGGSVTALLRSYGAFEEALCRHFVRQILQGLNYLHERDIIHRDIKGANILVDNKGGIKISDFGISKKVEETFLGGGGPTRQRTSLQGSVFWMAPEVVKQVAHTRKADIWSVGCLVVEMLTGNHPYPTLNQMQAIFKIGSSAKPTIPSDISPEAEDFLAKTFEIDYEKRPDADELLQHPWIVKGPSAQSTTSTPSKPSSTKSKASKTS